MTIVHQVAADETVAAARAGDVDALRELWRTHQPQVLRFLRAKRSPAVDDVASAVWVDVGRSMAGFDGDGRAFRCWLFTLANQRSIDERRRVARRRGLTDDGLDDIWRRDHVGAFGDQDALEQAIALVRRLPESMATAVMLRVVFDLSISDTAAVMGCSEGNVRVLSQRGVTRLRAVLGDDDTLPMNRPAPSAHTASAHTASADTASADTASADTAPAHTASAHTASAHTAPAHVSVAASRAAGLAADADRLVEVG